MNTADFDRYRQEIIALHNRVHSDILAVEAFTRASSGGQVSGELTNTPLHLGDMGTDEFLYDMNAVLGENEAYLAGEIDAALARLDKGSFGLCGACGREIAAERLEAMPYARLCIHCAQASDEIHVADFNRGRPRTPDDTLAPEGDMEEEVRHPRGDSLESRSEPASDRYAAGTPGGGTEFGGLAGSNVDDGEPLVAEIQDVAGGAENDGAFDHADDKTPLAGPSGGAVGGTPARKRAK